MIEKVEVVKNIITGGIKHYVVNDVLKVPVVEANADFIEVQQWLKDKNEELEENEKYELKERNTLKDMNEDYEAAVFELTKDIPKSEIDTWVKQEAEARAYALDNTALTPLIDSILVNRPRYQKDELITKIIAKADLYAQAVGNLTGIRQAKEDEL